MSMQTDIPDHIISAIKEWLDEENIDITERETSINLSSWDDDEEACVECIYLQVG